MISFMSDCSAFQARGLVTDKAMVMLRNLDKQAEIVHHDSNDPVRLRLDEIADDFVVEILHWFPLHTSTSRRLIST